MPFIGNQPALSYTSFAKQDFTTSATTSYTLDNPVANANELALFINFVRQEPTTAYTASGTSLTLTSATSASDDMYCVFLGKAIQTVNPPNGSVGTSQIVDDAVTTAKILDANITSAKLASGLLPTNTPAFHAYLNFYQSLANNTGTKLQFNTEVFDTDNCYDNTTNYRFTPTTAGKYYIFATVQTDSATDFDDYQIILQKNGSVTSQTRIRHHYADNIYSGTIVEANGSTDYFEAFVYQASGGTINASGTSYPRIQFGGYKIIE